MRKRLARIGVSQRRLADELGIEPSLFSRQLSGDRRQPADFEARVEAALDRLERAERAAREARERILTGTT